MQIFGRDTPSPEALWGLYEALLATPAIWHASTFAASAKACGLRRVAARKSGYFAFSAFEHATGQAPITEGFIEEMRLFIGEEPRDLAPELWEKDRKKHAALAKQYAQMFQARLGAPRVANSNQIFETNGLRVRVLVGPPVWVVISSLDVIRQLPNDWWKPEVPGG